MADAELYNLLVELHSASFAWAIICCRDREVAVALQSVYVKLLAGHPRHRLAGFSCLGGFGGKSTVQHDFGRAVRAVDV